MAVVVAAMRQTNYSRYDAVRVACPYYLGEATRDIRCEGVVAGGCLVNHFANGYAKTEYMRQYCHKVKGCEGCLLHQMLTGMWQGGGPERVYGDG